MRVADAPGPTSMPSSSKQFAPHCILSYYGLPRTATLIHETVAMDLPAELK